MLARNVYMQQHIKTQNHTTASRLRKKRLFGVVPFWPSLLVVASALLALLIWTLPNLNEFVQNVAQFPLLWQVEANRREIIRLVTTVFAPITVALLVGACCWIWSTVKPFIAALLKEARTQQNQQQELPTSYPMQGNQQQEGFTFPSSAQVLPVTPLPAVFEEQREDERTGLPEQEMPSSVQAPVPYTGGTGEQPVITINLLGEVSMTVQTADGVTCMPVPLPGNAIRVQLLAYIAWLRGKRVNRDNVLEDVFARGKDDEEATPTKLTMAFDSHRKLIRADLRAAISRLNELVGYEAVPLTLDIFANGQKSWWLSEACRVADLEAVDAFYRIIVQAENSGQLATGVPDHVHSACESLIAAYTGDFLETLLQEHPDDFDPWTQNWARKPFTLYRDYLLEALWYAGAYEMQAGHALGNQPEEALLVQQNQHFDCAARFYRTYAMRACNSRFDMKVSFSRTGREHGERVAMSERALRRCLMLYGALDSTHMVDKVYKEYSKLMRRVSADTWQPNQETLADLEAARSRTSAYRLQSLGMNGDNLQAAERS